MTFDKLCACHKVTKHLVCSHYQFSHFPVYQWCYTTDSEQRQRGCLGFRLILPDSDLCKQTINKLSILKMPPEGPVLQTFLCESVKFLIQDLILLSQTGCYCYEWNAVKWIMGVSEGRAELWGLFSFCLEQTAQNIYDWEADISPSKEHFLIFRTIEKVFRVYTEIVYF